jgi:hypothetical protein
MSQRQLQMNLVNVSSPLFRNAQISCLTQLVHDALNRALSYPNKIGHITHP